MKSYIASLVLGLLAAANANAELVIFDFTAKVSMALRYPNNGANMESLQSVSFNAPRYTQVFSAPIPRSARIVSTAT
ncbi:hypothetical protein [Massilia antarctica]|uniref:hypothetical protein n=1 Tax=Massilia antarctica TaxID=2765360 RepID=UPI0035F0D16D